MGRDIGAVVAGVAGWWLVAAVGYWLLSASWPEYALAEPGADFTSAMLVARLFVAFICSMAAGFACGVIAGPESIAPAVVAGIMLILLVPIQYAVWDDFPTAYNLIFLGMLVPLIWRNAKLASRYAKSRG
jgi:uncharacterized membrane protein